MTYNSLQEIEVAFAEPANETETARKKRLKSKSQAIKRFNERHQKSPEPVDFDNGDPCKKKSLKLLVKCQGNKKDKKLKNSVKI